MRIEDDVYRQTMNAAIEAWMQDNGWKVIGDALRDRLHKMRKELREAAVVNISDQLPAPHVDVHVPQLEAHVHNEVSAPAVNVMPNDMDGVAAALLKIDETNARFATAIEGQNELLSQLLQVLAAQQPPVVKNYVEPAAVAPPNVTVESPRPPERKPRKLELLHEDGTKTIVREIA